MSERRPTATPIAPRVDDEAARRRDDLSLALRAANMGWWEWDLPDGEIRWSEGHEISHGTDRAGVPRSYSDYLARLHPEDRARMDATIREAIASRGSYETEFRTVWPDGTVHWMHGVGRCFVDESGEPVRLAGVARLIDDQVAARHAVRDAEQRFRRLADLAPILLWKTDASGGTTFVNEPWAAFTGRPPTDALGHGWESSVHPDDVADCRAARATAHARQGGFEVEYRLRRADGSYRWVLDRGRARHENDVFVGHVGGCVDIHERKEGEDRARAAAETRAILDAIYADAPIGLAFFDTELRYARVNAALAEINGVPAADHIGRTTAELLPEMDPQISADIGDVLRTGEPIVDVEVTGSTPAAPGCPRHYQVSYYRVALEDGEPLGVGATVIDVTERRNAETERETLLVAEQRTRRALEAAHARSSFLARLGAVLERSLQIEDTLADVVALLRDGLADVVAIDVAQEGRPPRRLGQTGVPGSPARPEDAPANRAVPLIARGHHVGAISLGWLDPDHLPQGADARHLADVAQRIALWIDNALLYAESEHVATTLQAGLLPPALPEIPGVKTAARYIPSGASTDVGGDFYDVFETDSGGWSLVVGDVCGKGAGAASVTALARYTLRGVSTVGASTPTRDLALLNRALLNDATPDRFLTAVIVHLDTPTAERPVTRLRVACAGHPPPIVLRRCGEIETIDVRGPLLGVLPDAEWPVVEAELAAGDALVLATDGVTEADRSDPMGSAELGALLAREVGSASSSPDELATAVEAIARRRSGGRLRDDVAVLVVRVDGV